jgi:hypothetical protein
MASGSNRSGASVFTNVKVATHVMDLSSTMLTSCSA